MSVAPSDPCIGDHLYSNHHHNLRKTSFDSAVKAYDLYRPHYAPQIFVLLDSYLKAARIKPEQLESKQVIEVLEIGCGTGQSTGDLLNLGYRIHALDLSPNMIKKLQEKFPHQTDFLCEAISFEAFKSERTFDLIYSSQAKHWVDSDFLHQKSAALLKDDGVICWVRNQIQYQEPIKTQFNELYKQYFPQLAQREKVIPSLYTQEKAAEEEIKNTGLFKHITIQNNFKHTKIFDSESYIGLMKSQSDHIVAGECIQRLYQELRQVILRAGNTLEIDYNSWITLARKK